MFLPFLTVLSTVVSSPGFVYRKPYVDLMKSTQTMTESELHILSDTYDSIYLHPVRTHTQKYRRGLGPLGNRKIFEHGGFIIMGK